MKTNYYLETLFSFRIPLFKACNVLQEFSQKCILCVLVV